MPVRLSQAFPTRYSLLALSTFSTAPSAPMIRMRWPAARSGPVTRQMVSSSATRPKPSRIGSSSTSSWPTKRSARRLRNGLVGRLLPARGRSQPADDQQQRQNAEDHELQRPADRCTDSAARPVTSAATPSQTRMPPGTTSSSASSTSAGHDPGPRPVAGDEIDELHRAAPQLADVSRAGGRWSAPDARVVRAGRRRRSRGRSRRCRRWRR